MREDYLITEKPAKALFVFALPMIIGNLFQQFYTMVDSMVVGRYVSEEALAAVGASYSLTNVFIMIAVGGGVGASVMVSRYFGAGDYRRMKLSVYTSMLSFLVISILLGLFGLLAGRGIMILLNAPENVLGDATTYLRIYFLGLPFLFMYNVISSMFNALGKSKPPLYLLIFSSVLNMILDVVFVTRLDMGVAGVAWATLIAQGISCILSFLLFWKELAAFPTEKIRPFFSKEECRLSAGIAFPSILQQSTVSIGMMLVQAVVNSFGSEALAGFSAAMRIESICVVPMSAMGNAVSSYTAQNLGAGRQDRVVRGYHAGGYGMVALFAVIICVIIECFHTPLIALFLGEDGTRTALETGTGYLSFMGWFFIMIGLKMSTDGVLRGSGDMKMFTVANLVNLGIRVSVAWIAAPRFGIQWVWMAVPMGWTANYLISYREYRTGKWREKAAAG